MKKTHFLIFVSVGLVTSALCGMVAYKVSHYMRAQAQALSDIQYSIAAMDQRVDRVQASVDSMQISVDGMLDTQKNIERRQIRMERNGEYSGEYMRRLETKVTNLIRTRDAIEAGKIENRLKNIFTFTDGAMTLKYSDFSSAHWRYEVKRHNEYMRREKYMLNVFDGGGGEDLLELTGGDSPVFIDGVGVRSIEKVNARHDNKNDIYVLAPGLVQLENDALMVMADDAKDTVHLDGCLNWKSESQQEGVDEVVYTAVDAADEMRKVTIKGRPVVRVDTCYPDYMGRIRQIVAGNFIYSAGGDMHLRKDKAAMQTPDEMERPHAQYKTDKAARLQNYVKEIATIEDPDLAGKLATLVKFMDEDKLPTERLNSVDLPDGRVGYTLMPHYWAMDDIKVTSVDQSFECKPPYSPTEDTKTQLFKGVSGRVFQCGAGNTVYQFDENKDIPLRATDLAGQIISDKSGNDIYLMPRGDWQINDRDGMDIIHVPENWGRLTLNKRCHQKPAEVVYMPTTKEETFGGIGVYFKPLGEYLLVQGVLPNLPAAKAGLRVGDKIIRIDGAAVASLGQNRVGDAMRGAAGSELTLTYIRAGNAPEERQETTVTLTRATVEIKKDDRSLPLGYMRYRYQYPFSHGSHILFDKNIQEEDLEWDAERRIFRHRKTGDEIILKGGQDCVRFLLEAGP